ncbi:MSMEG_4193 family putative phosphomutase [Ruania alkalisoli]|uniref:MSMEG_4193 family putative phosphomutase n=1 Tax=Ruania alkalisoli TaxID=2779775 RepID=A0A7M1SVG5_9MICO|nr:histidine phosphatase family protein [Ruania alkalisoli]QOR71559.1 MSMEG_4193 family putative phosphomutase [Ruania alkalisoli]
MATVILVRHGRSTANVDGVLAGRTPGVLLDDLGREQAERTAQRLAVVPLVEVVSSPIERCVQTARTLLEQQDDLELSLDEALTECDYGRWQGLSLGDLVKEPLWPVVQSQPSAVVFPGGESLAAMQARAVGAIRRRDAEIEAKHGAGAVWAVVSHGDIIKSVLADALGMHLDLFQRLNVGPASISVVRYGAARPDVVSTNTEFGDLTWLRSAAPVADAPVGGGAGREAGRESAGLHDGASSAS